MAGTGNKDLRDKAFRHGRILGLPVLLHMCLTPCFNKGTPIFLDFWFYCACQAERFIPEVLVARFSPLDKGNEDSGNKIEGVLIGATTVNLVITVHIASKLSHCCFAILHCTQLLLCGMKAKHLLLKYYPVNC